MASTSARVGTQSLLGATTFGPGAAAAECKLPDLRAEVRPNPDGEPTRVKVAIWLMDLAKISDIDQNMSVDLLVLQSWQDPRLAGLDGCRFALDQVWSPQLDFLNSGRVFPGLPNTVRIGKNGTVSYRQRYRGSLSFPHRLDRFPFDIYILSIALISPVYVESEVQLEVDKKHIGRRTDNMSITDWDVGEPTGVVSRYAIPTLNANYSRFSYNVFVKRLPDYFVWKVIVPLILIVAMSWTVFWMNPIHYGPQIGMSATSMLTLIAFQFAMVNILPKLNYFTLLDRFITLSTILVFLGLVESLTTAYLVTIDKKELGLKIDKICRWAFPLAFFTILIAIFIWE